MFILLFKPDFRTEIIGEDEYFTKIAEVEDLLSGCAVYGTLASFDRCPIAYEYYLSENSRASIVIVHGFTEFSRKYREMAWYFLRMGYSVFIYDQRGHGHSGRSVDDIHLAHIDNFSDYVRDLEEFCNKIVMPNSDGKPIYMYSQSMGGAVVGLYLNKNSKLVDRAVFSAPMIAPKTRGLPRKMLRFIVTGAAHKNGWNTKFKYASEFSSDVKFEKTSDLSRARFERNLKLRTDDIMYQNSSSTNRWMHQALSVQDPLLKRANTKKVKSRILIISAENDTVVRRRPQEIYASRLPLGSFVQIRSAKHNLYNSNTRILTEYVNMILDFFGKE